MEKPPITYNQHGSTGNIFFVLARVRAILNEQGRIDAFCSIRDRVFASGSYEAALAVIGEEVTLIDTSDEV